jgi:nucleotide-binding universal stress UspA family protein
MRDAYVDARPVTVMLDPSQQRRRRQAMFRNVLVGVDFRQGGRDAIALASQLLDRDGSMALTHVYPGNFMPSHAVTPGLVKDDRERAEAKLEQERADADVEAELIVTQGPTPGQVLHETAEERDTQLLVVGSCHRGVLGRTMLGDDTRASLNGAPCAIAIAPAGYAEHLEPIAMIGVAYDTSPESEAALETARTLAASRNAQIRALRIVSLAPFQYGSIGPLVLGEIEELVDRADAEMKALDGVDGRAEYGLPASDLEAFGNEVDLLIVGSRGYGPWGRLVHGSTSIQLARHTHGPLLIVPRSSHPTGAGERTEALHTAIAA